MKRTEKFVAPGVCTECRKAIEKHSQEFHRGHLIDKFYCTDCDLYAAFVYKLVGVAVNDLNPMIETDVEEIIKS